MVAAVTIFTSAHTRSRVVCQAMAAGISRAGGSVRVMPEAAYREPVGDIAVFYGLAGQLRQVFRDYSQDGRTAVYVDLGYWDRKFPSQWTGFHKLALNSRHPTEYFQRRRHPHDRVARFNLELAPWRRGRSILVAGMGDKAAEVEGFAAAEEWERAAIAALQKVTDRPIIYRPKPSFLGARPIEGTRYSPKIEPLEEILRDCWAVVTHHSNTAIDGLIAGVPAFALEGVAAPLARRELELIEAPLYPDDGAREQWLADIAYTQWNVAELADGSAWRHLRDEGLVP